MKHFISLVLALCLCFSLCACGGEHIEEKTVTQDQSAAEAVQVETQPIQEQEISSAEPEANTAPVQVNVKLLCEFETPQINCSLIAVNPAGFPDGTINFSGASALINYLLSFESENYAANYGVEQFGEKIFYLCPNRPTSTTEPETATAETATVRFGVSYSILSSGLLEQLISDFCQDYGYSVEIIGDTSGNLLESAETGAIDVLFVDYKEKELEFVAEGLAARVEGLDSERNTFIYTRPVICGPADDPAGINGAVDAGDAVMILSDSCGLVSCGSDTGSYEALASIISACNIQADDSWLTFINGGTVSAILKANENGEYIIGPKSAFLHFIVNGY